MSYTVLPDDRRLRGMAEVLAYFEAGDVTIGAVVAGLYAHLLPHVNFERGDYIVDCTSSDGANPRECRSPVDPRVAALLIRIADSRSSSFECRGITGSFDSTIKGEVDCGDGDRAAGRKRRRDRRRRVAPL